MPFAWFKIACTLFLVLKATNAFWISAPTKAQCEANIRLYDQIFLRHTIFTCCNFPQICSKYQITGSGENKSEALNDVMSKANVNWICRCWGVCTFVEKNL
ncbi:hypothetical protein TcWFU_002417 [Taenia crassiceps]|uniref:Secreted protein n=1 Tax=Taenia crassiceps TaxID=6207 RepID=A0ABR4PZN4_9CEST